MPGMVSEGKGAALVSNSTSNGPCVMVHETDVTTGEQLGTGGSSVVYRGTWLGTPVAIKKWLNSGTSESEMSEMRREIMSNAGLRHPNIVTFCGACTEGPSTFMVTELMPFSLLQVLYDMPSIGLPVPKVLNMASDICHAFVYLHSRRPRVIHRDLKPHNLLLDRAWKVKLCDFGLAGNCKGGVGTPAYMAPELLTGDLFTDKVDVYAFGVVLNEILCRRPPFFGIEPQRISELVKRGDRPDISPSIPEELKQLIKACWDQDAACRPEFKWIQTRLSELQL